MQEKPISYRYISRFYYPLALTSILSLGVYPLVTFFLGHSRMSIESLAALPVINSLVFIFRSMGLSFQEVGIALLGENNEGYKQLRNFAAILGSSVTLALALLAFTPLSFLWFQKISGLSLQLSRFAITPTKILTLIPGLSVLIAFQRGILVTNKRTTPLTIATAIEVITIICLLYFTINILGLVGAVSAAIALISGRILANIYLLRPSHKALTR
jgi:O-antigen/teichoic acid export membrane protein